jgi:phosphoglycerol transferase
MTVFLFGAAILNILIPYLEISSHLTEMPTLYFVVAILIASFVALLIDDSPPKTRRFGPNLAFALAIITALPFAFTQKLFGTRDVASIMITMSENKGSQMMMIGADSFGGDIVEFTVIALLVMGLANLLLIHMRGFRTALLALSALLLITNPVASFVYRLAVPNPAHALINPAKDMVPPKIVARPTIKKNLIIIYLESVERTYRNITETAVAFKALGEIEDRGISARMQMQIPGLHFTAGGIVGSMCGVPLLPRGVFSVERTARDALGVASPFSEFMPSMTCLGDMLQADGYTQSYLNGSDLAVFSKGDLFLTHGFDRVFGLKELDNWQAESRQNLWGLDDDVVFEQVTKELYRLSKTEKPFTLAALTLSTHGPDAFLDKTCTGTPVNGSLIPDAIRCTGAHLQDLLAEVDKLGLTDDTVVVFMSDHLAMKNTMWEHLSAREEQRSNFVTILGAGPARIINRTGTTLDLYPTILEALGYTLEGGRAYMGRSIFSEHGPTLIESIGQKSLSEAVVGNTALQEFIWK